MESNNQEANQEPAEDFSIFGSFAPTAASAS